RPRPKGTASRDARECDVEPSARPRRTVFADRADRENRRLRRAPRPASPAGFTRPEPAPLPAPARQLERRSCAKSRLTNGLPLPASAANGSTWEQTALLIAAFCRGGVHGGVHQSIASEPQSRPRRHRWYAE